MNVLARLGFELAYYFVAVRHFSNYAKEISSIISSNLNLYNYVQTNDYYKNIFV